VAKKRKPEAVEHKDKAPQQDKDKEMQEDKHKEKQQDKEKQAPLKKGKGQSGQPFAKEHEQPKTAGEGEVAGGISEEELRQLDKMDPKAVMQWLDQKTASEKKPKRHKKKEEPARPATGEANAAGVELLGRRALAQVLLEQKYASAMNVMDRMNRTPGLPENYGVNNSSQNMTKLKNMRTPMWQDIKAFIAQLSAEEKKDVQITAICRETALKRLLALVGSSLDQAKSNPALDKWLAKACKVFIENPNILATQKGSVGPPALVALDGITRGVVRFKTAQGDEEEEQEEDERHAAGIKQLLDEEP